MSMSPPTTESMISTPSPLYDPDVCAHVVIKRDGTCVKMDPAKIKQRLVNLCNEEPVLKFSEHTCTDIDKITCSVVKNLVNGISTSKIDELAAKEISSYITDDSMYEYLAGRVVASNHQKLSPKTFTDCVQILHDVKMNGIDNPLVSQQFYEQAMKHKDRLNNAIVHARDFRFKYFGFMTLYKQHYLWQDEHKTVVETPQYMYMRIALFLYLDDIDMAIKCYNTLSLGHISHATPTMFNSGSQRPQMASCFILKVAEDSLEGIAETWKQCAIISKYSGGIGISCQNIRASGTFIRSTNGRSNGIVPLARTFDTISRYVDQGGGKRKGSFAMYTTLWHSDIMAFLHSRTTEASGMFEVHNLSLGVMVNDLFMDKVLQRKDKNGNVYDKSWALFSPDVCPELINAYGEDFERLYNKCVEEGKYMEMTDVYTVQAKLSESMCKTGYPYLMMNGHCNRKSNHKHMGTILSSNLCTEILEYYDRQNIAVCNLGSIPVCACVKGYPSENVRFDFDMLVDIAEKLTRNLNRTIDISFYPLKEAKDSNMASRPLGIGVQGLADAFFMMGFGFDDQRARELNRDIFEAIYYGCCKMSIQLAKEEGERNGTGIGYYDTYPGSPASQGKFQFDLWEEFSLPRYDDDGNLKPPIFDRSKLKYDWESLRVDLLKYGMRNSLLTATMPTATSAQILGNFETFRPPLSNLFEKKVLSGTYTVANQYMIYDLKKIKVWSDEICMEIKKNRGSIQHLKQIPKWLRNKYKTIWEIGPRKLMRLSAERGPFICQSQSLNIFLQSPTRSHINGLMRYGYLAGLKTVSYYCKSRPAVHAYAPANRVQKKSAAAVDDASTPEFDFDDLEKYAEGEVIDADECDMCGS